MSLLSKNLFFDFGSEFFVKNESIPPPADFAITDEIYNNFVAFLQDKEFDYQTESEEKLDELIELAKREKYYDPAIEEFQKLKEHLAHDKNKDLAMFKDEIKYLLKEDIIARYYYQKGRIISSLGIDDEIIKAIDILNDKTEYKLVLAAKPLEEALSQPN